ncbi:solute carrier family 23 protein [Dellaglioa algida]|uniref:Uracil transporter n=1 Tax=Dellaglioa algida TaxID=105612 RepID=A0A2C8ELL1_9LACO|nr:solute carrier family 23 protein [Dellaglioa algida]MDK1716554.1 NCS2 family nucleobase:cation symporter [Dellaglioa algida]MDK1718023.1 NCS2 family nucleobase:cation symporter [Dellaglioa algida]MDK1719953.1 NCS2 family nucleobase:cation symporter [Dellaglioa algida]MDK1721496.1 NCS2 family nucleobase:cation symporter [Dellaglioa algida]MDK1723282.1 NCS2 family nucleobase:cation symporter [Dellaglioa algida]
MAEKFRNEDAILDIHDRPSFGQWMGLSIQHLFTMFGATVLVPILVGLNPSIALFSSGVGTLVYIGITNGKIPAYLGSSFAFIAVMQMLMKTSGYPAVAQGTISAGLVYLIVSIIIGKVGSGWLDRILPAVVVGPVVMVIGLSMATTAASNAMLNSGTYDIKYVWVAIFTLGITIFFNMYLKGFISLIPILLGIVCGYIMAVLCGIVDFSTVEKANWFTLPAFNVAFINYQPKIYWSAIIGMAPIAFVTMTEHMGHIMVLNKLTKRNFFKDPGLNRTLFGDGVSSIIAGFVGGPPTTSYGENIGVLAMTKVHSIWVIGGAAFFAIIFSFVGKISALIQSIPGPVIGGISFLLFGVIASSGLRILIDNQIDYDKKRNLMITASILVLGIGGMYLKVGDLQLTSIALATVVGIALNLILPKEAKSEK